jgi:DNA-binding response OmpR family regulator
LPATDHATVAGSPSAAKSDYVLIVDGSAAFANHLESELASAGLETVRVSDVETARQMLVAMSPGAVVLDLRFAGLPRTDLLTRLSAESASRVSVVVLEALTR